MLSTAKKDVQKQNYVREQVSRARHKGDKADDLLVQMHRPSLKSDTMPNISRVNCCNKSIFRSPCSRQIYLQTSKFSFITQSTV